MRILKQTFFAAFLAISSTGLALAESEITTTNSRDPEQVREQIERLYRLEQAFLACDHVRVTGHDLKRLDDAIAEFELTAGIPENELESIYEQVEKTAAEKSESFCAEMNEAGTDIRAIQISGQE